MFSLNGNEFINTVYSIIELFLRAATLLCFICITQALYKMQYVRFFVFPIQIDFSI